MEWNRKDHEGHSYLIPSELLDQFDCDYEQLADSVWMSARWYQLTAQFDNRYSQFMKS